MAHRTYNELWREAQHILEQTVYTDNSLVSGKPCKDRKLIRRHLCKLYVSYVVVLIKLTECYDQMTHPQKRSLIKKTLELITIRYLEIKHEIVDLDSDEFLYCGELFTAGIVTDEECGGRLVLPPDLEIQLPECYRRESLQRMTVKNEFIDDVRKRNEPMEQRATSKSEMTEDEAIRLIQMHERARQGRLRAQAMKSARSRKEKSKELSEKLIEEKGSEAAVKIQRLWRGYITRRKIRYQIRKEMILIGMLSPEKYAEEERIQAEKIKEIRYELQQGYQRDYEKALLLEKEYIQKYSASEITQGIKDQIRKWYLSYKQRTGKFPEILSDESGGSAAIIGRYSPLTIGSETSKSTMQYSNGSGISKKSKSKKSDSLPEEKRKASSADDSSGYKLNTSTILSDLINVSAEYEDVWKSADESDNVQQTFVTDIVKAQKYAEVESDLRKTIDAQLRVELEELQLALSRDKCKKGKKPNKKKKSRRAGKKSKKKKDKDLTPDRSTASLFEELVLNGIIRKYPPTPLSTFTGHISYYSSIYQNQKIYTAPSTGDIRQVIRDYCVLPMSSLTVHQSAPLVRSLLIAGPSLCGKNMLVNAICTEIGAVFFDLSPANIVGKYPGKTGLVMLIHLVNKVSKLLQPSIIYIDDAEKTFMRKVPKTDKTDPKRLKKDISKIIKAIGPNDLVMLIGVTHCPWECDQKALLQTYGKVIMISKPDYNTLRSIWFNLLEQYKAMNEDINLSVLCKLCDGYTIGTLIKAVQQMMTCKRIIRLKIQPLTMDEIINAISLFEPIYKEEEDIFLQWYMKMPVGRNKQKNLEMDNDENSAENMLKNKK